MDDLTYLGLKRPDAADRARPLCYGDFVMLSCTIANQGSAYLCEEGCIVKDPDVEMRVSSRELTFQICTARDARTLQDIYNLRQKYGMQATDIPNEKISFQMSPSDAACYERLLKSRITEEHANDAYSQQMKGRPVTYGDILQLKHIKRQSYLGIDISQAPRIESCTKRIFLTSEPAGMVRFKILPRFHYLVEGNTVCFGDNISLCSADLSAQYLHTSPGFRSEDIGIVYEVNASDDSSTIWSLECFFSYDSLSETHVKTGDVVRLYHPSCGGLLAAAPHGAPHSVVLAPCGAHASLSSSMWVVEDEAVVAGGLLRTMRSFALMHLVSKRYLVASRCAVDPAAHRATVASHSAHAREDRFATVGLEPASTPAAGLLLQSLEGVSANACVAWGERFHILSAETGRYLHAADAVHLAHPPNARPHPGDRVVVASPAMFREDSFEIQRVPDEQVRAVEALSRMLPAVRGYRDALQSAVRRERTADFPSDRAVEVMERLDAMRAFVYTGAATTTVGEALGEDSALSPRPACQNFMRDLGVDDLLADVLRHSCDLLRKQWLLADPQRRARFLAAEEQALHGRSEQMRQRGEEELATLLAQTPLAVVVQGGEQGEDNGGLLQAPVNRPGRLVCELAYEVLLHMVRRNLSNAARLAKHLDELQQQLALRAGAERLLREIFDGNDELLAPDVRRGPRVLLKRHLRFHIDALVRDGERDPRHLSFLALMVSIGDRGVEEHQNLILPELLRYRADIFLDVQVDNQTLQLRDRRAPTADLRKWVDLSLIVTGSARSGADGAAMRLLLDYWRESLLLLSSLCRPDRRGRRDFVVRRVQSLVTFETCLRCLDDDSLPTALRWAASELVRVAFVERDDFVAAARRGSVVVWADLDRPAQDDWPPRPHTLAPAAYGSDEEAGDMRATTGAEAITQGQADALKRVLREYFEQNPVQYYPARVEHANKLRASMLRLGRQLVRFGHYRASELADVLQVAVVVIDVSNLRIEDEDQRFLAAAAKLKPALPQGPSTAGGAPGGPAPAMEELGIPVLQADSEMVAGLTEATISCALRRLRGAARGLSPLEVARLRCVFEIRSFAAGQAVAEQGALQEGMYFIQSGTAFCVKTAAGDVEPEVGHGAGSGSGANLKGGAGRAETVVMTLAPGQVFGLEALTGEGRARWPWHVRCAAPLVALFVPAETFERMVRQLVLRGASPLTDGLANVLEMMREACLILSEVYDIRLQLRNRRLLQEYHFDVQVSGRRYRAAPRAAETEAETDELRSFPLATLRRGPVEFKTRFRVRGVQVLGPLSPYVVPLTRGFADRLRIDHAVAVASIAQVIAAVLIVGMVSARITTSANSVRHPGPAAPVAAVAVNIVVSTMWCVSSALTARSAALRRAEGVIAGLVVQALYVPYFACNTAASLAEALLQMGRGSAGASADALAQALWLGLLGPCILYSTLLLASLAVHVENEALFEDAPRMEDEKEGDEQAVGGGDEEDVEGRESGQTREGIGAVAGAPTKFAKPLGLLELDRDGTFSRMLIDLFSAPHRPLVAEAFRLLVRTHSSAAELHRTLAGTQVLAAEGGAALLELATARVEELLDVANAVQAHNVDSSCLARAQRAVPLLRAIFSMIMDGEDNCLGESESTPKQLAARRIFQHLGLHHVVLRLLSHIQMDRARTEAGLAYAILAALCDGCAEARNAAAAQMQEILRHLPDLPRAVCGLLASLLADNPDQCEAADETLVGAVARLLQAGPEECHVVVLQLLVVPSGRPGAQAIRRNQGLVLRHLACDDTARAINMGRLLEVCQGRRQPAWVGEGGAEGRALFAALLNLLAACMAGGVWEAKRRCRGGNPHLTITPAQIEEALRDRTLPACLRAALLHYWEEAYIHSESAARTDFLGLPAIFTVFDAYARYLLLLPTNTSGSRLAALRGTERPLLLEDYPAALSTYAAALPPSVFLGSADNPDTKSEGGDAAHSIALLAVRVIEAFAALLPDPPPAAGGARDDISPEEELACLTAVTAMANYLRVQSHPRLKFLEPELVRLLGPRSIVDQAVPSQSTVKIEGDGQNEKQSVESRKSSNGLWRRPAHLLQLIDAERRRTVPLDIPDGVASFADEFLAHTAPPAALAALVAGSTSGGFAAAARLIATRLLTLTATPVETNISAAESAAALSDGSLSSLVGLLVSAVGDKNLLQQDLCSTGLALLYRVVDSLNPEQTLAAAGRGKMPQWLVEGLPRLVVRCVTAQGASDELVGDGLNLGIALLRKGGRPVQDAFYHILCPQQTSAATGGPTEDGVEALENSNSDNCSGGGAAADFFGALRDRMVRAERALPSFQALFWERARELGSACAQRGQAPTVIGVEAVCARGRAGRSLAGSHALEVMLLLQQLCEGHNRQMQEFLRQQGPGSVDLVSQTCEMLASASRGGVHPASAGLVLQALNSLVEFVQNPCPANQRILAGSRLPHVLNRLLQAEVSLEDPAAPDFHDIDDHRHRVGQIKNTTVTLLLSLLEGVDSDFIPSRILEALEVDAIVEEINYQQTRYMHLCEDDAAGDESRVARAALSENVNFKVACSLYTLLAMLRHYDTGGTHRLAVRLGPRSLLDCTRLRANCGFVEIARNGRLERVFFQVPAVCRFVTREAKNSLRQAAEADNHQDTMLAFVESIPAVYEEMLHLQGLERSPLYRLYTVTAITLRRLVLFNALASALVSIIAFRYEDSSWVKLESVSFITVSPGWFIVLLALSIAQTALSSALLAGYMLGAGALEVRRRFAADETAAEVLENQRGGPRYYYLCIRFLLQDPSLVTLGTYLVAGVLAVALCPVSPISFLLLGVHLVDVFHHSTSLADVLQAVSSGANTLLQTVVLCFALIYAFATVGFICFPGKFAFDNSEVESGDTDVFNVNSAKCDSLWKCLLVSIDQGMRKGDIGGGMDNVFWREGWPNSEFPGCDGVPGLEYLGCSALPELDNGQLIHFRIAFTSTFFLLVDTIIINIIFGVIIDNFGDLRQSNEEIEEEMDNTCFICGVHRSEFEKASPDGKGFERHVRDDHNLWSYLAFLVHMSLKSIDEHTGFESHVFPKIFEVGEDGKPCFKEAPDVSWFPNGDALALQASKAASKDLDIGFQISRLVDEAAANADDASSRLHAAAAARERAARARAPVTPATTATDYTHTSDSDFDEEPSLAAVQAVVVAEPAGAGDASPSQLSLFNLRTAARAERAAAAAQQQGQPTDTAAAAAALGAAAVAAVAAAPGQFVEAATARVQGGVADAAQRLAALATGMGGGALVDLIAVQSGASGSASASVGDRTFEFELQELAEQGFDNQAHNRALLELHSGDLNAVLAALNGAGVPGAASSRSGREGRSLAPSSSGGSTRGV